MESSETTLDPSPDPVAESDFRIERRTAARSDRTRDITGVQEAPTSPSAATQIEREDLLEYKLLGSRASYAELQATMYSRELQRAQAEQNTIAHEARQLVQRFGEKYNVDMTTHMVTEDGYLIPRPVADSLTQLRR